MSTEELLQTLSEDSMGRLRWRVLREFHILPCSREAGEMSDAQCLEYALHMMLDGRRGEAEC